MAPHSELPPVCYAGSGDLGDIPVLAPSRPRDGLVQPGQSWGDPWEGPAAFTPGRQDHPGCLLESVVPDLEPFGEKCAFL